MFRVAVVSSVAWALVLSLPDGSTFAGDAILLEGGTIVDGTGAPAYRGDLLILDGRIHAVGQVPKVRNATRIDVEGMIVAPGFIDLHNHSDRSILTEGGKVALNYLTQGVTTIVTGNCGSGHVNVARYYARLERQGIGLNVAHLIPHGSLRQQVMGNVNRPPGEAELRRMKRLVERGMRAGAWGLSTGLIYTPGCYAETDELIALARVVGSMGGIYASHIRGEGADRVMAALREAVEIGAASGAPVHISHLKASGPDAWGMMGEICRFLEQQRARGQRVTADQYPYTASSTSVAAMVIPEELREGGRDVFFQRLKDPEFGERVRRSIEKRLQKRGGPQTIMVASLDRRPSWVGKTLDEIAKAAGMSPVNVVLEIEQLGGAGAVAFTMSEEDVRLAMRQPWVATASDGSARIPDNTKPHPRSYGCFPRKIGRYALEWGIISLEHAVRSSSGLPADILGLTDRGYIQPGKVADLVVFDPDRFRDRATFEQPHQYSEGVFYLFVNGELVIDRGRYTGALAGRPLRHAVSQRTAPRRTTNRSTAEE